MSRCSISGRYIVDPIFLPTSLSKACAARVWQWSLLDVNIRSHMMKCLSELCLDEPGFNGLAVRDRA